MRIKEGKAKHEFKQILFSPFYLFELLFLRNVQVQYCDAMPYRLPTQSVIKIYFDISPREEKLHYLEKQTNEKLDRTTEKQSIS